jgi:glycosyltransferase involved in cell wall biosynthesis
VSRHRTDSRASVLPANRFFRFRNHRARNAARYITGVSELSGPLISVALTVKDGMPHLRHAIESLQRQTYRNFELIVHDGASQDDSVALIQAAKDIPRIEVESATDRSIADGYDRAYRRCRGDLVHTLGSDESL